MKYDWRNEWAFVLQDADLPLVRQLLDSSLPPAEAFGIEDCYFDSPLLDRLIGDRPERKHQFRIRQCQGGVAFQQKSFRGRRTRLRHANCQSAPSVTGGSQAPAWFAKKVHQRQHVTTLASRFSRRCYDASSSEGGVSITLDENIVCSYPIAESRQPEMVDGRPQDWLLPSDSAAELRFVPLGLSVLKFKLPGPLSSICKQVMHAARLLPERTNLYREGIVAALANSNPDSQSHGVASVRAAAGASNA